MKKNSTKRTAKRKTNTGTKLTPLTDEQIESLAAIICRANNGPEENSQALLVLMDEIIRAEGSDVAHDIAYAVKRFAFSRCGDEAMNAQAELLRSEVR